MCSRASSGGGTKGTTLLGLTSVPQNAMTTFCTLSTASCYDAATTWAQSLSRTPTPDGVRRQHVLRTPAFKFAHGAVATFGTLKLADALVQKLPPRRPACRFLDRIQRQVYCQQATAATRADGLTPPTWHQLYQGHCSVRTTASVTCSFYRQTPSYLRTCLAGLVTMAAISCQHIFSIGSKLLARAVAACRPSSNLQSLQQIAVTIRNRSHSTAEPQISIISKGALYIHAHIHATRFSKLASLEQAEGFLVLQLLCS